MKKKSPPAFQCYPDLLETRTRHLDDGSFRILMRILNWIWLHSDDHVSIPADPMSISVLLGEPVHRIEHALAAILNPDMPLLKEARNKLTSLHLKNEWTKVQKYRAEMSKLGIKSALKSVRGEKGRFRRRWSPNQRTLGARPAHVGHATNSSSSSSSSNSLNEEAAFAAFSQSKEIITKKFFNRAGLEWICVKEAVINNQKKQRPYFQEIYTAQTVTKLGWKKMRDAEDLDSFRIPFIVHWMKVAL